MVGMTLRRSPKMLHMKDRTVSIHYAGWALALVCTTLGCSGYRYTHSFTTATMQRAPAELNRPLVDGRATVSSQHEAKLNTHELVLTDDSGVVCAGLMTELERTGNAAEALHEARREGKTFGTVEYSYRLHSPAEYRGLSCGGYFRWGSGEGTVQGLVGPASSLTHQTFDATFSHHEGGFWLGGMDTLLSDASWLRYAIEFRFGFGDYDAEPNTELTLTEGARGGMYLTAPLRFGLLLFPEWAYGFGVAGMTGADVFSWFSEQGRVYIKFDASGRVEYTYGTRHVAASVYGGWEMKHTAWGDHWVKSTGPFVGAYLQLHWGEIL